MYAKCGSLAEARAVFDGMQFRDAVSWTSMISAYGTGGKSCNAAALFSKMQNSGLCPDSIAFISVLSACSHSRLLEEGRYNFKLMTKRYKIIPRIEHFACLVDLLGRAGKVEEAYRLLAVDHLFRLVPEQSGYYVLLSNIYAKAGRWDNVTTVRSIMKRKGLKKMPGAINVEINDRVYTFLVGDQSHAQSKKIYEELDVLVGKMKEAGYVPETDLALHNVEEEDKEYHIAVHSEKLAIVFAILNTKPGTPIRVTKNLRICGDCHIAAKLI
ncbi:hypothetical protein EZV62_006004 [Acer yangbiense]|uniref:DYW domain-containing protein n=1 Tax=Acer yangbiense TaxID=1000413 RepID=A0A5C7IPT2_9ROSI|nr:hypothetical protein EZV62_006004 [Acer yangbiense]